LPEISTIKRKNYEIVPGILYRLFISKAYANGDLYNFKATTGNTILHLPS